MKDDTDIAERVERVSSPASLCNEADDFDRVHNTKVIPQMDGYNEFCEDEYHEVRVDVLGGVTVALMRFINALDEWHIAHINACHAPQSTSSRHDFQSMVFLRTEAPSVTLAERERRMKAMGQLTEDGEEA